MKKTKASKENEISGGFMLLTLLKQILFFPLLLITVCNCHSAQAQKISIGALCRRVDEHLAKIQNVSYGISVESKDYSDTDTFVSHSVCTMARAPADPLGFYFSLIGTKKVAGQTFHYRKKYDGQYLYRNFFIDTASDTLGNYIDPSQSGYNMKGTWWYGLLLPGCISFLKEKNFRRYHSLVVRWLLVKNETLTEDTLHGMPCFKLTIVTKNVHGISNNIIVWYINRNTYLPIAKRSSSTFQGMHDYKYFTIDYKEINAHLPDHYFQVNTHNISEENPVVNPTTSRLKIKKGMPAPIFTAISYSGDEINLSSLKGQVVVLDFWYLGCPPCLKALPHLVDINKKYHNLGLAVIGINLNNSRKQVQQHFNYLGAHYPSTFNTQGIVDLYGIHSFPTTIVLDQEGKIAAIFNGYSIGYEAQLKRVVKKLLVQK